MGRKLNVVASAPYLGRDQEVHLEVRFGDRTHVVVESAFDDPVVIRVQADLTGHEGRYGLVTGCLESLEADHEASRGEPPTRLLVMSWEKALNDAFGKVLLG